MATSTQTETRSRDDELYYDADALRLADEQADGFSDVLISFAEDAARERGDDTIRVRDVQAAASRLLTAFQAAADRIETAPDLPGIDLQRLINRLEVIVGSD